MDTDALRQLVREDERERLDDILSRWHNWKADGGVVRGWKAGGNVTDGYQASRQYDDQNGALDDALENRRMRQVDFEIGELHWMQQAVLCAQARSLCTGAAVFHHPRVPPERRATVLMEARAALTVRLIAAGVLTG